MSIRQQNDSTIPVPSVEVRSDLQAVVHHQKHTSVAHSRRAPQSNSEHLWTPSGNIGNWKQPSMLSLKYNMRARRINEHDQTWWFLVLSRVKTHAHLNAPVPHRTFLSPDAILHISRHGGYTNLAGQANMARITSTPLRCSPKLPKSFTVSKSLAYTTPIHYLRT